MPNTIKINLGFALACIVICFVTVSSYLNTKKYIDDNKRMAHTLKISAKIEKMSSHFLTAQNNLRGYYIGEQKYYFELYEDAIEDLHKAITELKNLNKDNLVQQKNVDELELVLNEKLKIWRESFDLRKKSGFEAIQRRARAEDSKNRDKSIFAAIDKLLSEENRLFAFRSQQAEIQGKRAQLINTTSGILACILIVIAAFLVYRDSQRRHKVEREMDQFFTLSLDLLCISGMDGFFRRLSPSFSDILGFSLEELYSKSVIDIIHPDDVEKTNNQIDSQKNGNKVLSFENRFKCKSGGYRTFSWKSVPVGDLMYAVARDVTNQKEFEQELVNAREAAQIATSAKSSFLANMSHEIRTPLNVVVGMTDILARTLLNEEQRKFVTSIRMSSINLLKIVNEILDFSKIEAGKIHIDSVDVELAHLIEEHTSLVGILALNKGIKLVTSIDPKIPRVLKGDSGKISQIMLNFMNNAIKYTNQGKIIVTADCLGLTEKHCKVKIGVKDSGIGISSQHISMLFKPFIQADNSTARKFGGTGLGLSICKRLVEAMNGEIGVESVPGEGSTFWIKLNLEMSSMQIGAYSELKAKETLKELSAAQKAIRKNIRILVAEDNQMNQMVIMNMMTILGYTAVLAENGRDAVTTFSGSDFDLILMDQHMPELDGIDACIAIRKIEEATGNHIPIIAFTATVIQQEQKEKYGKLMDDFILKPVSLETLETTLSKWESKVSNRP